ncbi:MAG TPA: TRAP transporter large permease [Pseudogracilibacillus sp.]|nr:TRAP transporter large permease [Pseudogracilibacillus sp.]
MIALLFISLFVMIFLGMDLMLVLLFSCALVIVSSNIFYGSTIPYDVISQYVYGGIDSFTFTAIPLFILAGEIMNRGGITDKLIDFSNKLVGHIRGSIGQSSILLNMFMAGVSGSAVADTTATGSVMIPAMKKEGYPPEKAAAIIAGSGTIGPVIPPSIPFIILGGIAEISVGKLFLAGLIPGVIMGLFMMLYVYFYAKKINLPKRDKASFKEVLNTTKRAILPLGLPIIILGSIITGLASPTESAVLGVLYALIVSTFVYRSINLKSLYHVLLEASLSSGLIMLIIGAGNLFGWVATYNSIGSLLEGILLSISSSMYVVLFIIVIMLIVMGCVIEVNPIILLVTPILYPIIIDLGVDPIHFGAIMIITLMTALLTPPVGLSLFITSSIAQVPILSVARAAIPFWLIIVCVVVLVVLIPPLTLFLPSLL